MTERDDDPYLDTDTVAEQVGLAVDTVRVYLKRSRKRVKDGSELRPQDFPLPDMTVSRSPAWRQSTIDAWKGNRVGRGRPKTEGA
ncbi:helix-turn-helix transcriptional regulator [Streptomyces sp. NPDC059786]|uniref:helix-turn-helix transcriptional regulator n=1 Tax=Streptomyces sp. NPDC059786 TaxID=3346946 RepID=UPI0036575614